VAGGSRYGLRERLYERLGTGGEALYGFGACLLALSVSGLAAYFTREPFLFPSLGPTAFLVFEDPLAPISSPRNTLVGHLVGVLAGALSLAVFGLLDHPSILEEGVTLARVGAAAFSVALTVGVQLLLKSSHPAAEATVLIVSLGLLRTPREMLMLMIGVVLLVVVCWLINRAFGAPVPVWAPKE
jgi:CBS-domain-containing membrane protein